MKKKILFVINTLSRAGAEAALLELLAQLAAERGEDGQPRYELSLFVLMNQGELVQQIPEGCGLSIQGMPRSRCSNQREESIWA